MNAASDVSPNLAREQRKTLATLFGGYVGYYFCRSHLSVAKPLILAAFASDGVTKETLGAVESVGVACYAIGKAIAGPTADRFGGRTLFLGGMTVSAIATATAAIAVGASHAFVLFGMLWALNRFAQSIGWVALVRVVGRWFAVGRHATVMGILSLSFLLGDAFVRLVLGSVIRVGEINRDSPLEILNSWPAVFGVAAGMLALIAAITAMFLRESPAEVGLPEPPPNPINLYRDGAEPPARPSLARLLAPLLSSGLFWLVCGMSFGLTLIRETLNSWTPTYLTEAVELKVGAAALGSVLPPLGGAAAVVLAGLLSDRIGGRHGRIILPSLILLGATLLAIATIDTQGRPVLALSLVTAAQFFLVGPYSYLAGVMALDLGGKTGNSTASALTDTAGYVGALLSGFGVGWLSQTHGWPAVFRGLLAVCAATAIVAAAFISVQERRMARMHATQA
jgi:OPA family glycerol-3-phosphate transporter-like MFS transporter